MRWGARMGDTQVIDSMVNVLTDPLDGCHMGITAERVCPMYGITREDQDNLAYESHRRAIEAIDKGYFKDQILPIEIKTKQGVKNLTREQADEMRGKDPDYAQRDLFDAIAKGDFPKWRVCVQIMPEKAAETAPCDVPGCDRPVILRQQRPRADGRLVDRGFCDRHAFDIGVRASVFAGDDASAHEAAEDRA